MASPRISLDPVVLTDLAGNIEAVHTDLTESTSTFGDRYGGLDSNLIEEALTEFDGDWSDKRAELLEQLTACAAAVRAAAAAFVEFDDELAGAVGGGTGPTGSTGPGGPGGPFRPGSPGAGAARPMPPFEGR